jgi:ribosomal protein S18 acetylase RimI-like enzyme
LPSFKGRGIGKLLISHIEVVAKQNNMDNVILNVNRYNPSVGFYLNIGYSIMDSVDIDIGEGFLMEDYIMGKPISY